MNLIAHTIYDEVAKTYLNPFYLHNDHEAMRMFMTWQKNPELPMAAHPEDYILYSIGFYDTNTGILEAQTPHSLIMKGSSNEPLKTATEAGLKAVGAE